MTQSKPEKVAEVITTLTTVAVGLATLYITLRVAVGPDGIKRARMYTSLYTEGFCQRQAEMWAALADMSKSAYDKTRNVSV